MKITLTQSRIIDAKAEIFDLATLQGDYVNMNESRELLIDSIESGISTYQFLVPLRDHKQLFYRDAVTPGNACQRA